MIFWTEYMNCCRELGKEGFKYFLNAISSTPIIYNGTYLRLWEVEDATNTIVNEIQVYVNAIAYRRSIARGADSITK